MVNVLCHLPYLEYVIFSDARNNPIFTGVPRKIRYFAGVTPMNKKQLWGAIFCILWCLLFIDSVKETKL